MKSENGTWVFAAFQPLAGYSTDSQHELKAHCVLFFQLTLEVTVREEQFPSHSVPGHKRLAISFAANVGLGF